MNKFFILTLMAAMVVAASAQTKKVSILGDSYSTFQGIIPANYSTFYPNNQNDVKEVEQVMSAYVGIVRSDLRLKRAWTRLDLLYEETEELYKKVKATRDICELRNMINVGYLITRQALERKESRGLHYTVDYPKHAYDQN